MTNWRTRAAVLAVAPLLAIVGTIAPASATTGPHVTDVPGLSNLAGAFGLSIGVGGRIVVGQQGSPADPCSGTPEIPGSIIEWHNGTTKTVATFAPGSGPSDVAAILPGIDGYTIGAGESGPSSDANHLGVTFGGSAPRPPRPGSERDQQEPRPAPELRPGLDRPRRAWHRSPTG